MSELGKKIATRESYGNALVELGKEHEDLIVLDADLAGATKTGIFKKAFPERHWDIGIAEANMTGIAGRSCNLRKSSVYQFFCDVCGGQKLRAGAQLDRLPAPQCEDRSDPCGNLRG